MSARPTKVQLLAAFTRLERRRRAALDAAVMQQGGRTLPRPYVREQLRDWFGAREDVINRLWRGEE